MKLIRESINLPAPFSITDDAARKSAELIAASQQTASITNPTEQQQAVARAVAIRTHVRDVEKIRTEITKPLLDAQRLLKRLADDYSAPLIAEQERVEKLVTRFQEQDAARVRAEEEERRRQFEELERQRRESEMRAELAAGNIQTEAQLEAAISAAEKAKLDELRVQSLIAQPEPERAKAAGASTRKVLRYEVEDIAKVYAARPELVKLELKASAVQACCVPEMPVPGLKLWWENQTSIRAR